MDLDQELKKIEEALGKLKPHIEGLKAQVGDEFQNTKNKLEGEVKKNPWLAIGIVALVCFVLGLFLSPKGRHHE